MLLLFKLSVERMDVSTHLLKRVYRSELKIKVSLKGIFMLIAMCSAV